MFLMAEKCIRRGVFHSISMQKLIINKWKHDKNKETLYIQYWGVNNLHGCAMLQKLPINNIEWIKDTSQFNEDFIKKYNEESGIFLKLKFNILKLFSSQLLELHNDLPFLRERMKREKFEKLVANLR